MKDLNTTLYNRLELRFNKAMMKTYAEEPKPSNAIKCEANSAKNDTLVVNIEEQLKNEMKKVVERLDTFICNTSVRLQKIETTLNRQYNMMIKINAGTMAANRNRS